jgi:hypothetical protein
MYPIQTWLNLSDRAQTNGLCGDLLQKILGVARRRTVTSKESIMPVDSRPTADPLQIVGAQSVSRERCAAESLGLVFS